MPRIDWKEVRRSYFDPPEPGSRIPTVEDRIAAFERNQVRLAVEAGLDPVETGLGEHGSLIGGPAKPLRRTQTDPTTAGPVPLMPLESFDYPEAHVPSPVIEESVRVLDWMVGKHLAGYRDRPDSDEFLEWLKADLTDGKARGLLHEFWAAVRPSELRHFPNLGVPVFRLARALHRARCTNPAVVIWINQFARPAQNP